MVIKDGGCDSSAACRRAGRLSLTVAICTWNRSQSLQHTLEGFAQIAIPSETDWELLVVNNNCTDRTDEVIRVFEGRLPVRRIFEKRPGLSNARIVRSPKPQATTSSGRTTMSRFARGGCLHMLTPSGDGPRRRSSEARLSPGSMATRRPGSGGSIQRLPGCTPPVISEPRRLLSRHT